MKEKGSFICFNIQRMLVAFQFDGHVRAKLVTMFITMIIMRGPSITLTVIIIKILKNLLQTITTTMTAVRFMVAVLNSNKIVSR